MSLFTLGYYAKDIVKMVMPMKKETEKPKIDNGLLKESQELTEEPSKWSPEPWDSFQGIISDGNGIVLGNMYSPGECELDDSNGERIIACVNGCTGYDPRKIKPAITMLMRLYNEIRRLRDKGELTVDGDLVVAMCETEKIMREVRL